MSKLYSKYQELKKENPDKIYIFKAGIFYIFLDEDAKKIGPILNLKLTNLNSEIVKCGFPVSTLEKYLTRFKTLPYQIEIVEQIKEKPQSQKKITTIKKYEKIANEISKIDLNSISISQAFLFLDHLQKETKSILKEEER